ncbi:MAG: isoprenyl transferase [Patescibacteria group bacterium]|nr:isoprenyl transferase [Patescibacteria group bacterium]
MTDPPSKTTLPPLDVPPLDVPPERRPRHIAAIMDGNGRWAQQRGLPRIEGHRRGADSVRAVTEECDRLGIEQLTLYCFSSENWKRPRPELDFLMSLLERYMAQQRDSVMKRGIRLTVIGRREGIPAGALREMDQTVAATSGNTGLHVCLAINYGGRAELTDAVRAIAREVQAGRIEADAVSEQTISDHLYTAGMPDPDLLIRTAGELRVSNFLLWQISYAELWVTNCFWPDFGVAQLHDAIRDYARRNRRFGGLATECNAASPRDASRPKDEPG